MGNALANYKSGIMVLSNSHGRCLYGLIEAIWRNSHTSSISIFKPNANMSVVIQDINGFTKNLCKKGSMITISGSARWNDKTIGREEQILETRTTILEHARIIMLPSPQASGFGSCCACGLCEF